MDINKYLFRDEALRGEKLALKFRWILIIVVLAFVILTYLRGDTKEASFALIPSAIFLCYNLINNAVKFTPEEGIIEIDAVAGKSNVLLSIKDTGIGIPEESLKDVFSVGANIHSKGTNNEKGSGFGLILCKELIRRNGGNIFVKSKPGEGSVFSITLPHS